MIIYLGENNYQNLNNEDIKGNNDLFEDLRAEKEANFIK